MQKIAKILFGNQSLTRVTAEIFKEFENLSVEKMTLSTALGFEPRSFDCRSTALTTELHRRVTKISNSTN